MYQKEDYVVKIPEGICRIEDVMQLDIYDTDKEYYKIHICTQTGENGAGQKDYNNSYIRYY